MINKLNKGFTLIETLAAILLLTLALVGPMTIAEKGLSTSLVSKDQNTAFNLAQDAVEYIRFARDTNCLASGTGGCPASQWLNGIGGNANTISLANCINVNTLGSNACYIDSFNNTVTSCGAAVCPNPINYDAANNNFTYASGVGTATIFTRTVQILTYNGSCTGSCNQSEADLTVTVSWSDPVMHSISVTESLYNWQ